MKIIFNDSRHSYTDLQGNPYISVSSFFKKFKEPFEAKKIATRSVLKELFPKEYKDLSKKLKWDSDELLEELKKLIDSTELDQKVNTLTKSWSKKGDDSRERGTRVHKKLETNLLSKGYTYGIFDGSYYDIVNPKKEYDNESLCDNLFDLPDGYYPELLIFNTRLKLAGQSDGVYIKTLNDERIAYINDYKTDQSINFKPDFFNPKSGYKKFLGEIRNYNDCNMNEYSFKMSTYGYMLEEFGFKVKAMAIQKVEVSENEDIVNLITIPVTYRKQEITSLVKQLS